MRGKKIKLQCSNLFGARRQNNQSFLPSIPLPYHGGSIRDMVEKLVANMVTGTGSILAQRVCAEINNICLGVAHGQTSHSKFPRETHEPEFPNESASGAVPLLVMIHLVTSKPSVHPRVTHTWSGN